MTTTPQQEREAIVRWLRGQAAIIRSIAKMNLPVSPGPIVSEDRARQYDAAVDAIERGDHIPQTKG